jgi:hypothetical protein
MVLFRTLVECHLVSVGDSWESFLVRNQFLPQHNNPVNDITQDVEEILPPQTLPHEVQIEIQLHRDPISSSDHQNSALPAMKMTLRKKEFVPKRSLETVMTSLKDRIIILC